jgi:3-hydroxybutyryl-CoA dehydrogenase
MSHGRTQNDADKGHDDTVHRARRAIVSVVAGAADPFSPLHTMTLVGLDTRPSILEYLHRSLGGKYRPCPLLAQHVKAGRLGRKVGKGVYEHPR